MTVTKIEAFIGEPGTGKTYSLTNMVKDLIQRGESVYIMNPTKSARNNVRNAFKNLMEKGQMSHSEYAKAFKSTHVLHGFTDDPSKNIFIDESAMVDLSTFYSLLYSIIGIDDVHIYLFGDMKQIEPVNGDSILKTLIESTIPDGDDRNIWKYVSDTLYYEMEDMIIDSPKAWKLDTKVDIKVFKNNFRLESKQFIGYNDDYYDNLIDNAIFSDDYSGYLKYAVENYWLITTPTNSRGDEINESVRNQYKDFKDVAPFVIIDKEYYLNPFNNDVSKLESSFSFLSLAEMDAALKGEFTAYMSTHRVQSFTVDNVIFYMGNNPIGNRHKSHYSNNLLYTAISRARHEVQILGLPESFQQMRSTMPLTAQQKNVHLRASRAVANLKKWIKSVDYLPVADEIYDKYVELYNDISLLSDYEKSILDVYHVDSKIYSKRYVIDLINNGFTDKFGFTLSIWLRDNSTNAKKEPRKGKIKQWIESLNDKELEKLKEDLKSRIFKQDEFLEKYGYNKKAVRQAF